MSFQFDWQVREDNNVATAQNGAIVPRKALLFRIPWKFLLKTLIVCAVSGLGVWYAISTLNARAEADLIKAITAYRNLEQQAARAGNGDLFRVALAPDPALLAAQFLPRNRTFNRADSTILSAKRKDDEVWTTVRWKEGDEELSRVVIYEREKGAFRRSRGTEHPWEQRYKVELEWGRIWLYEADIQWQLEIETFVGALVDELCVGDCLAERLPLDLVIQRNFSEIAVDRWIYMPSPHLVGLTAGGAPADAFWPELRQRIVEQLVPATITFAIPADLEGRFQALADQFHSKQTRTMVTLIPIEGDPAPDDALLAAVDGAFMMPTVEQITSGQIVDLTDYAATDPTLAPDDFYRRVWEGTLWQGRVWALPQAAKVRLVFYPIYPANNLPEVIMPNAPMTARRINELRVGRQTEATQQWEYIDTYNDILLTLLMGRRCQDSVAGDAQERLAGPSGPCRAKIDEQYIAELLTWYADQIQHKETPNLAALAPTERQTYQSSASAFPPRVTFWIEDPAVYEFYAELYKLRVRPLTNESNSGVTPLHVQGSVVSQRAEAPRAVWQWISFLSRQRPISPGRDLPARKSVKSQMRYFTLMPHGLREEMKTAIATARPLQIDEQHLFAWEILDDFLQDKISAGEAAALMVDQQWFTDVGF